MKNGSELQLLDLNTIIVVLDDIRRQDRVVVLNNVNVDGLRTCLHAIRCI